jgi:hypothetical protein
LYSKAAASFPPGRLAAAFFVLHEASNVKDAIKLIVILAALACAIVTLALKGYGEDALDVVNRQRATRGLRAFQRDEGLSIAAERCAQYRAKRLIAGHTSNDFAFVPKGSHASTAGCAAWDEGFGACALYDNYRYAGAAWVRGRDGRNYCHVFYR